MAWESIFRTDRFSVAIAKQNSNLTTYEAPTTWVLCELPQIDHNAVQSDPKRSSQSAGASHHPFPGRVIPQVAIKFPVCGQLGSYVFSSDTPNFKGLMEPLGDALADGSSTSYQVTCFEASGSDANTAINKTSSPVVGALLGFRETSGEVSLDWVESISGSAPWTATLFEDFGVVPSDDTARIPTTTNFPAGETESYGFSLRVVGESSEQDVRLTGWVPETYVFTVEDDALMCTATGPAYGGEALEGEGGLQALTSFLEMDSVVSTSRYVLGSNVAYDNFGLDDGTADPDGTCDLRNMTWTFKIPHKTVQCPTAIHGVGAVTTGSPMVEATFAVPEVTDYEVDGVPVLLNAWQTKTRVSLTCYYGNKAGKILAFRMPAGIQQEFPKRTEIDGVWYRLGNLRPGNYTGDTATQAGRKSVTVAVG